MKGWTKKQKADQAKAKVDNPGTRLKEKEAKEAEEVPELPEFDEDQEMEEQLKEIDESDEDEKAILEKRIAVLDKKKRELKETYIIQQYATQTESYIYNKKTGEKLDTLTAIVKILNILEELKE